MLDADPYEKKKLADDPAYTTPINMRENSLQWVKEMPSSLFYPEHFLIEKAFPIGHFGKTQRGHSKIYRYYQIKLLDFLRTKNPLPLPLILRYMERKKYWAVIACSNFGPTSQCMESSIGMPLQDKELIR